jgi:3-oxoadipate enol-lactonase
MVATNGSRLAAQRLAVQLAISTEAYMSDPVSEIFAVNYQVTPPFLTKQVFERKGCPIHYWVGGSPEQAAVVCMHGALMDHRMFNGQTPVLLDRFRFLTWDARGHGKSQPIGLVKPTITDYVEDALEMMDHAGVEKAVLIAQSLGAYVAQHLTRSHLQRVSALVLIGSTPIAFRLSKMEYWALQYSVPIFGLWPYKSLKPFMARNTTLKEDIYNYALSAMHQVDRQTFLSIWSAVSSAVSTEGYPDFKINIPFLLTHGDSDRTGTIRRDGPRWAAADPNLEYVVIPQAGHNANQDNPSFFNRILLDFLDRFPLLQIAVEHKKPFE